MIKYTGYYITFQEVPNEISLVFTISNCPHSCPGCHSPWLAEDIGNDLLEDMPSILARYMGEVTCVCFMGEGQDPDGLYALIKAVNAVGLKTCLYSGSDEFPEYNHGDLTYIKTGGYKEDLGGLDKPTTNQRMWRVKEGTNEYDDITSWFWRKKV